MMLRRTIARQADSPARPAYHCERHVHLLIATTCRREAPGFLQAHEYAVRRASYSPARPLPRQTGSMPGAAARSGTSVDHARVQRRSVTELLEGHRMEAEIGRAHV